MYLRNLHARNNIISQVERCTSKREIAQYATSFLPCFFTCFRHLYHLPVPTIVQEMVRNNSNILCVQSRQLMEFCTKQQDSVQSLTSNRHCRRDSAESLPNV